MKTTKTIKNLIADEVVRFFRTLRVTGIIGFVTILVMYFGVYQSHRCFNPYSNPELVNIDNIIDIDTVIRKIDPYTHVYFPLELRYSFADAFYQRVYRWFYDGSEALSVSSLKQRICESCRYWCKTKLGVSIRWGLAIFLVTPFLVSFSCFFYHVIVKSKNWVDKHKTKKP